jgi:TorA maturation chaperone TorD
MQIFMNCSLLISSIRLSRVFFKDHLVPWIEQYLLITHGEAKANEILSDIDRR